MPEDPNEVVHPGARPKVRLVRSKERADSEDENESERPEHPEERPGIRYNREDRDLMVMHNANQLTERQYKNLMVNLDYEKMNDSSTE